MAVKPTPAQPVIVNDDGSLAVLVYLGRTFRLDAVESSLTDATGYKARFALGDPNRTPLATASTDDGSITLTPDPATGGTAIAVTVSDEATDALKTAGVTRGRFDLVLESPGGEEDPLVVGSWTGWIGVSA